MAPKAASQASNAAETPVTPINEAAQALETSPPKSKEAAGVMKRSSAFNIDGKRVTRREGWNPRFDFGDIAELASSLLVNGMLNPIRVKRITDPEVMHKDASKPVNFELIDGDRRFSAVELLIKQGKYEQAFPDGIPAIIVDKNQDDKTSYIQTFVANETKSFLPLEEAIAYKRMKDEFKMTIKQICAATGRKQVHVMEILNLADAAPELKEAVAAGKVGKTDAKRIATVAKGNKAKQAELAAAAAAAGKDKGAKRNVKRQIEQANVQKAKARGKTLKIRALSDLELSDIGAKMAEHLMSLLEAQDIAIDADLVGMFRKDPMLVVAYTTGALDALKVAAGATNNLKL